MGGGGGGSRYTRPDRRMPSVEMTQSHHLTSAPPLTKPRKEKYRCALHKLWLAGMTQKHPMEDEEQRMANFAVLTMLQFAAPTPVCMLLCPEHRGYRP